MVRFCSREGMMRRNIFAGVFCVLAACAMLFLVGRLAAQQGGPAWASDEKPIYDQIKGLRALPDNQRASETRSLAIQIRGLSNSPNRVLLAEDLASLSTEGDLGADALQEVASTLTRALVEHPVPARDGKPSEPYMELGALVRYEHVEVTLDNPQFAEALRAIDAAHVTREQTDFKLADLNGTRWELRGLRGKVVLVNFWATWCPPCRKEMPDLDTLYQRFQAQGFEVLGITDEDASTVAPFIGARHVSYPILLDPGRKVGDLYQVPGIPMSFVYDRDGKLVAEAMDMRTEGQFLKMLTRAGLP
jgi:peroxiredoxin